MIGSDEDETRNSSFRHSCRCHTDLFFEFMKRASLFSNGSCKKRAHKKGVPILREQKERKRSPVSLSISFGQNPLASSEQILSRLGYDTRGNEALLPSGETPSRQSVSTAPRNATTSFSDIQAVQDPPSHPPVPSRASIIPSQSDFPLDLVLDLHDLLERCLEPTVC